MDLDDDDTLLNKYWQEISEERIQYFDMLYEKYVIPESVDIDLRTLKVVKGSGCSKQLKFKPFGYQTEYKTRKGKKTMKIIKRRILIQTEYTDVRYELESEEKSNNEQSSLEISKNCSSLGIQECFQDQRKIKSKGIKKSSSNIYGQSEDKVQLNCETPKSKTSKLAVDTFLSLTTKSSSVSTKSSPVSTKRVRSDQKQLPTLKVLQDISYSFCEKSDSVLCRSPISACSVRLRQLIIRDDPDGYNTDRSCKRNKNFQSSDIKGLKNDLGIPKITRRCLFKTSEDKVVQNKFCSINLLKGNGDNIANFTDIHHESNSPVFNRSCYTKVGKKIIEDFAVEEDIYYDNVIGMNATVSPKSNSYNAISCNTPTLKSSSIKPLPCSPVLSTISPKINLKSVKISFKNDNRMNT